jgi:hypothetical protein
VKISLARSKKYSSSIIPSTLYVNILKRTVITIIYSKINNVAIFLKNSLSMTNFIDIIIMKDIII